MKTKSIIYIASLLALTACTSDDTPQQPSQDLVPVTLSYQTLQAVDTRSAAATNLNDANIVSGKQVKVQIANVGSNSWDSYIYTTGEDGAMTAPTSPSIPLYPTDDTHIKIIAFSPSDAGSTFTVAADQTDDDAYHSSDLMFSNNVTDQAKQVAPVPLTFVHKMAKVVVNVTAGTGVSTIVSATLKQVKRTGTFSESEGTLTNVRTLDSGDTGTDVVLIKEGDAATASGAAVIPAQTIDGALLEIVTNLGAATYSVASKEFESGHKYTLNISVSRTAVNTTTSIGTWVGDGSVTVNSQGSPFMTFTVGGVTFKMVYVEGGATLANYANAGNSPATSTSLTISKDYYMGQTEVTNALWYAVMGSKPGVWSPSGTNNGQPNNGDSYPVAYVSWEQICTASTGFLDKLNDMVAGQLPTGMKFSLPTEGQWEYAARGGKFSNSYTYAGSNTIDDVAWYTSNSSTTTHPVATKPANELGIYDMTGNVWEWCSDWYGSLTNNTTLVDPTGAESGSGRGHRGGSWGNTAALCVVGYRNYSTPTLQGYSIGFRLALQ